MAADGYDKQSYEKEHLNIVFMGHVDVGKSTLSGQILLLSGQVDERTIQKYEKEAKEKNRESWWLAYIMDTNEEERAKGKTVEVGRAPFQTKTKRYTILDAPGHAKYVPNMIAGAAQADIGILVISARKSEFEAGFNRGGQTREHAMLAITLGVRKLIVCVNKMDEETVNWSEERFLEIQKQLKPFLKKQGFKIGPKFMKWIPISAFTGANIFEKYDKCAWYKEKSLIETLDEIQFRRKSDIPLRIPILDKFKDRGTTVALGKVEAGTLTVGKKYTLMPNKLEAEVTGITLDLVGDVPEARCGENVQVRFKGIQTNDLTPGMVLCDSESITPMGDILEAKLSIFNVQSIFSAGYTAVLHVHTCTVEVEIIKIVSELDKRTMKIKKKKPRFVSNGSLSVVLLKCHRQICVEEFKNFQQLGRFTLRSEGTTIAQGLITKIGDSRNKK